MSRYFMHNQELESVDTAKYLGVNISKDLGWNTHITVKATTVNRQIHVVGLSV